MQFITNQARTINRFGRRNGAAGIQSREPLTLDRIREVAPSVFAGDKHVSRSGRYTYIPTSQIVEHLMNHDYGVFAVNQGGSRDEEKRGFTKHLVRLRPLSQPLQVGGTHNEIVLVNSHDGTSAYRLMAGVFRLVCSNGMIVAESMIEDVRIPHTGDILSEVAAGVDRLREQLPVIGDRIRAMQAIDLTPDERGVFARAALTARYGAEPPVPTDAVLTVRRPEDREPTLSNTLNVLQEALVRGGQRYVRETERGVQRRTTSPVRSVDGQ